METREPTWITPELAKRIWFAKGPMGEFNVTPEEDAEIRRVWQTLPGFYSWADTLISIGQGFHPVKERT